MKPSIPPSVYSHKHHLEVLLLYIKGFINDGVYELNRIPKHS